MKNKWILVAIALLYITPAFGQETPPTETSATENQSENSELNILPQIESSTSNLEEDFASATLDSIETLKQQNFDFNTKDDKGNSVLYYALMRNPNLDVIKKIIEYGADVNLPSANGIIPLNVATSKANELQLQIMMMQTMGLDTTNPEVQNELKKNLFREMNKMIEVTKILIANGANINQQSPLGTPLMNAVTNSWNTEIVKLLIDAGVNLNQTDKDGKTALFYAASSGNDDIVTMLIKAGANTDIKSNDGKYYLDVERIDISSPLE